VAPRARPLTLMSRRENFRALAGFVPDCAVLFSRLAREPRVPRRSKALLLVLVGYLALPFDVIPDFIPGLGQVDDAVAVAFVLRRLLRRVEPAVIEEHWPGPRASLKVVFRLAGT
jgi:uncharacterized membrane protein YkvA (DUF1232 family)